MEASNVAYEHMSRAERCAMASYARQEAAKRPEKLTEIPKDRWPPSYRLGPSAPVKAWESREHLAQLYDSGAREGRTVMRLSICRVTLKDDGHWDEGLSWEELMKVKRDVGYADWYAIEIYPRDQDIVNVANMRHLWLLAWPLSIGWFSDSAGDSPK
jgi:hypothetical protein